MRFQLPQFIETETKLIGPFTLKQFMWVAAGAACVFVVFIIAKNVFLTIFIGGPIAAVFLAMAFVKINDMPMINYVASALSYALNPKKYIYGREATEQNSLPDQYVTYHTK